MEFENNLEQKPPVIIDNTKRGETVILFFWLVCVMSLISAISNFFEWGLLNRLTEEYVSEEEATANDIRQFLIGLLVIGFNITLIVTYLNWFRRAYGNLVRLKQYPLEYSEVEVAWSWFIPIVNLYKPYKAAREIVRYYRMKAMELTDDHKSSIDLTLLGIWWALWLIRNFTGNFVSRMTWSAEELDELIFASELNIVSDLIDIPAAIAAIFVIKRITEDEKTLLKYLPFYQR